MDKYLSVEFFIIALSFLLVLASFIVMHIRLRSRLSMATMLSFIFLIASPYIGPFVAEAYINYAYPISTDDAQNTANAFMSYGLHHRIQVGFVFCALIVFAICFFLASLAMPRHQKP